jgi:RNA polymerase sigma-70 factor (ECF subfamily)
LTHLVRKLPEFKYRTGGSFRNWLRVVLVNKWRERRRRRQLPVSLNGTCLEAIPASPDAWALEEVEYRQQLIRSALPLIRSEFSDTAWQAFEAHVVAGRSAAAVADELGIRVGTVYAAKSRILTRLRSELVQFLDADT